MRSTIQRHEWEKSKRKANKIEGNANEQKLSTIKSMSSRIAWKKTQQQQLRRNQERALVRSRQRCTNGRLCVALRDFMWLNSCRQFAQFLWFICLHTLEMIVFRWNVWTKNQFNIYDRVRTQSIRMYINWLSRSQPSSRARMFNVIWPATEKRRTRTE